MLSDKDIKKLAKSKELVYPFRDDCLQPASYDVHLGPYFLNTKTGERHVAWGARGEFVLPPGELWLGATLEKFYLPANIAAQVEGRSSWGRLGLMTHITAGFIDPGFMGMITLELYNVNSYPLILPTVFDLLLDSTGVEPIAQVSFIKLSSKAKEPYSVKGHYRNPIGPQLSRLKGRVKKR